MHYVSEILISAASCASYTKNFFFHFQLFYDRKEIYFFFCTTILLHLPYETCSKAKIEETRREFTPSEREQKAEEIFFFFGRLNYVKNANLFRSLFCIFFFSFFKKIGLALWMGEEKKNQVAWKWRSIKIIMNFRNEGISIIHMHIAS